ncbi:hypothetical protein MMC07_002670 [Pseudocyphellaria aurata]|nr:hypothetical protein [Pseudocyphellaria aurata]
MTVASLQMTGKRRQTSQQPQNQLPAIAPKHKTQSTTNLGRRSAVATLVKPRLPPRSRFGCWTCRDRKVKCDEARPRCSPCARLGHLCDYNPRLAFKDDTPRVVEKMKHLECSGSLVWDTDSIAPSVEGCHVHGSEDDSLPPFSFLTNDEDREKKAEYRAPGTYNVVVNPSSFTGLNEYRESSHDPIPNAELVPKSLPQRQRSISCETSREDFQDDPNVVILAKFEGEVVSLSNSNSRLVRSTTSTTSSPSLSSSVTFTPHVDSNPFSSQASPNQKLFQLPFRDGQDHQLIAHFNRFVQPSLAQVHRDALGTPQDTDTLLAYDVFAQQAAHFPPLFHALMALTALSMNNRGGVQNEDALEHYQKALPSLKESLRASEDLSSDVALLTHFILLLYEIAASEPRGSNYWSAHLDQLLRIIKLRHDMYGPERYSFIVWWIFVIDVHAVLTGGGNGIYAESLLNSSLLPETLRPTQQAGPNRSFSPCRAESESVPSVLEFHRAIYVQAAQIGLLARDLREEIVQHGGSSLTDREILSRQLRTVRARDRFEQTWNAQASAFIAMGYGNDRVPVKHRGIFEHTFVLYRACIIYTHTTMWPTQRLESGSPNHPKVSQYAREILQLGREIVDNGHLERKFLVFPLFMAGFVSESMADREEALDLLTALEQKTMGRVANASKVLLELVYERQQMRVRQGGNPLDVDWIQIVVEKGMQVVNCRL